MSPRRRPSSARRRSAATFLTLVLTGVRRSEPQALRWVEGASRSTATGATDGQSRGVRGASLGRVGGERWADERRRVFFGITARSCSCRRRGAPRAQPLDERRPLGTSTASMTYEQGLVAPRDDLPAAVRPLPRRAVVLLLRAEGVGALESRGDVRRDLQAAVADGARGVGRIRALDERPPLRARPVGVACDRPRRGRARRAARPRRPRGDRSGVVRRRAPARLARAGRHAAAGPDRHMGRAPRGTPAAGEASARVLPDEAGGDGRVRGLARSAARTSAVAYRIVGGPAELSSRRTGGRELELPEGPPRGRAFVCPGPGGRIRTGIPPLDRWMLCQLSYPGVVPEMYRRVVAHARWLQATCPTRT